MDEYGIEHGIDANVSVLFIINFCIVVLSTFTIITRLLGRLDADAPIGADDYLAIFSSVQGLALFAIQAWCRCPLPLTCHSRTRGQPFVL